MQCNKLDNVDPTMFNNNNKIENCEGIFYGCTNLAGTAPELWKRTNITKHSYAFWNAKKLSNYSSIPSGWK